MILSKKAHEGTVSCWHLYFYPCRKTLVLSCKSPESCPCEKAADRKPINKNVEKIFFILYKLEINRCNFGNNCKLTVNISE